jgi:quinol-cytochrome oxidoreductase complex cytochrome b subunit
VKADPFISAPAGIKPEWYFLFMFQTLKLIPSKVWLIDGEVLGVIGCSLAGLFWMMLPFFEKDESALALTANARTSQIRTLTGGLSVFALAYVIGMTIYGFIAK